VKSIIEMKHLRSSRGRLKRGENRLNLRVVSQPSQSVSIKPPRAASSIAIEKPPEGEDLVFARCAPGQLLGHLRDFALGPSGTAFQHVNCLAHRAIVSKL
jgi:hypothetical protein